MDFYRVNVDTAENVITIVPTRCVLSVILKAGQQRKALQNSNARVMLPLFCAFI